MTGIVEKTAVKNLAERMYAELNEILAKDLGAQRELSEKFKNSDDALRTQLERIEASGFPHLRKPASPIRLRAALESLLGRGGASDQ